MTDFRVGDKVIVSNFSEWTPHWLGAKAVVNDIVDDIVIGSFTLANGWSAGAVGFRDKHLRLDAPPKPPSHYNNFDGQLTPGDIYSFQGLVKLVLPSGQSQSLDSGYATKIYAPVDGADVRTLLVRDGKIVQ